MSVLALRRRKRARDDYAAAFAWEEAERKADLDEERRRRRNEWLDEQEALGAYYAGLETD